MIIRYLTIVFLFIFITIGNIGGCGGGDDGENCIEFSSFFNGQNAESQTSEWDCIADGFPFSAALFEDGTGVIPAFEVFGVSEFTFQTDCTTINFQSELVSGSINFLGLVEGGVESGMATFTEVEVLIEDVSIGTFDVSCVLDTTPEDTL